MIDDGDVLDFAKAQLDVYVQCCTHETAYTDGGGDCFTDYAFSNWGWTNLITPGDYTWPLWAGTGQCDTTNRMLVGSVTVNYNGA